ncbi:glycosyl hydrolase family 28-related protein [Microbacterium sp. No. 7]|uniref:glycosyl hydrolase family 28-related protein n=1 Tax=Microbacterium sp. No. 7 TaxID=1714373 RepID=UPI0006D1B6D4|nr:glycosyl hydrolase family 28-related protein [Microbacterium sp. No. 7]ALJ19066.1 hypothetical protein AOA12_03755 [Microbacterium sp. No. 7]
MALPDDTQDTGSAPVTARRPTTSSASSQRSSSGRALNVLDYGADRSGVADSTAAIQAAVDDAITSGSGTIVFPNREGWSKYRIDGTITVAGIYSKVVRFEFEDSLLLASENVGAPVFKIWSPYADTDTTAPPYLRRISLRDLRLQAHENWASSVQRRRLAFDLRIVQDIEMDNVWISGFRHGGIDMIDVWDGSFSNVQMLTCGWGDPTDVTDPTLYYALSLRTKFDNTNATHWNALHIEQSPLMLVVHGRSRHNHFVNSKFEQRAENTSALSAIQINGYENSFANIHFTQNHDTAAGGPAFFRSPPPIGAGEPNYPDLPKKYISVVGSSFSSPHGKAVRWFEGGQTKFLGCVFQHAKGDAWQSAFDLDNDVTLRDCEVTHAAGYSATMRLRGAGNRVENLRVFCAASGNSGATVSVDATATSNDVSGVRITGAPATLLGNHTGLAGSSLGSNRVKPSAWKGAVSANSGDPVVFDTDLLKLTGSTVGTITNFRHAYSGQALLVVSNASASTIVQHGALIKTKTGADVTLAPGATMQFVHDGGVWYQVT